MFQRGHAVDQPRCPEQLPVDRTTVQHLLRAPAQV